MGLLRKWIGLSPLERGLFLEAAFLIFIVKLRLLLFPSSMVRDRIQETVPLRTRACRVTPRQLAWAVTAAGRFLPGGRGCLPQALATETLLRRHGFPAQLKIGVARAGQNDFQAHAWVESEGEVLVGKVETPDYKVLSAQGSGG